MRFFLQMLISMVGSCLCLLLYVHGLDRPLTWTVLIGISAFWAIGCEFVFTFVFPKN